MARKVNARTVVNRKALTAIRAGFVDGMENVGRRVLEVAQPNVPDATPFGEGLVTSGDYGIWADGRKVAGTAAKPRGAKVKQGVTLIVGYGFPGRFQELGTVKMAANPFLTPAMTEVLPGADAFLKPAVRAKLGSR